MATVEVRWQVLPDGGWWMSALHHLGYLYIQLGARTPPADEVTPELAPDFNGSVWSLIDAALGLGPMAGGSR
jgi:hypothetical protein